MTTKDLTPAKLKGLRPRVRVLEEPTRILVKWWEQGVRKYRAYRKTPAAIKEAQSFAKGTYDRLTTPVSTSRITVGELWHRYLEANRASLRPRTVQLYHDRWRKWALFIGPETIAEDVPTEAVARFRAELSKHHAVAQVRAMIRVAKIVYNWADQMELIGRNRVARYRFKLGKEEVVHAPPEYRANQWEAMLRALKGGQFGRSWKAWAIALIAGSQGERIKAILHLRWTDIDWPTRRITWPKATNKQGRVRSQPMTYEARSALLTAEWWALRRGDHSPYVFPGARDPGKPYPYAAFHYQLREAERAAGVPYAKYRGAHGLRKMAAGDVAQRTGDAWLALQWIGDRDPRRAQEYVKERDDRMEEIAAGATPVLFGEG